MTLKYICDKIYKPHIFGCFKKVTEVISPNIASSIKKVGASENVRSY